MKFKTPKVKLRIGHANTESSLIRVPQPQEDESVPRGWIHPSGKFFETRKHWESISTYLRKPTRKNPDPSEPEQGERDAHLAYSLGWISIGHGGVMNAIGHKSAFEVLDNPAVQTLRKLVAKVPQLSLRVEKQKGKLDVVSGKHADFDVSEYDLNYFIRRGRLKKS